MGGAMTGIGGMAFLFGETIKFQAEDQIQSTLRNKVSTINDIIDQAETLAYGLNVSVTTLHVRRAETPETYQELTRQFFQGRPEFVNGLGFGQKEYGVLPNQQWLFPYYQSVGNESDIRYVDQTLPDNFYPNSERYSNYFLSQENQWTVPYQSDRGLLLTYYSQIFDNSNEWLGTVVIDVDGTYLSVVLDEPILRGGGELMLLTEAGDVIAHPANADERGTQVYTDISGLQEIWPQLRSEERGFIEGEAGYWSYTPIPERDWLLVAYVPYDVVFGRVMVITLGATVAVGVLLAGMVVMVIRYLNRRLQPVLNECQRLSKIDATKLEQLQNKDELEQLSLSFFYLLDQRAQHVPLLNQVTQRMNSLVEQVVGNPGNAASQLELEQEVQQWGKATQKLCQQLTDQVSRVESIGHHIYGAVGNSQQSMASATAELERFRQKTTDLPTQVQTLLEIVDINNELTQEHQHVDTMSRAQRLVSRGLSIFTQASQPSGTNPSSETSAQLQRLMAQFRELNHQFSQALTERLAQKREAQAAGADLSARVRSFDRYIQSLDDAVGDSHSKLGESKADALQVIEISTQMTESSQQLEELLETIQQTVQAIIAIADETQTRLRDGI